MRALTSARAGAAAVAPMLVGVVPFGLVAGATPVADGLGGWVAVGLSTIVFAGASQLAFVDVLAGGGSTLVAVLVAWTINLRMVLYSASLAPYLPAEPTARRLGAAYLLTDQAYAVSITRWYQGGGTDHRMAYFLGAGSLLWFGWQVATVVGVLAGSAVPDAVPLDFGVPLVFLVLLVPLLTGRPALAAAAAGGAVAVAAAEVGAGHLSLLIGSVCGIAAGALVEVRTTGRPEGGAEAA